MGEEPSLGAAQVERWAQALNGAHRSVRRDETGGDVWVGREPVTPVMHPRESIQRMWKSVGQHPWHRYVDRSAGMA